MNILQSFKMAMKSIMGNKMRSFLTMLGIIIGVASVIILVSLVNGQMSYMTESFASMGTNQITVNVTNLSTRSVSVDEMYEFYEDNRDLFAQMTPNVTVSTTVKNGTESSTSTTVSGVSEEYLEMKDMELESGRFIQYSDIVSRQKVCVVGYYVAWDLYGGVEKAIDQTIKIGGNAFRIIGVAARQDDDELESGGSDDFVWMPYSCAAKMTRNANISSYTFATADMNHTEEAKTAIDDFLMEIFKDDDLYRITAMSELLDSLNSMIRRHFPAGSGRGSHEYHAGIGNRADQRDRYPQGPGGEEADDHAAVRHRGGGYQLHRRCDRNCHRISGDYGHRHGHGDERDADAQRGGGVLQRVCGHWTAVWVYAGESGGEFKSD